MDDRNLLKFVAASACVMLLYFGARQFLGLGVPPKNQNNAQVQEADPAQADEQVPAENKEDAEPAVRADEEQPQPVAEEGEQTNLETFPNRVLQLGTLKPDTPYYLQVDLDTAGAAVEAAWLNDPRYMQLEDKTQPLRLLGSNENVSRKSFELSLPEIDEQLEKHGTSLTEVDWKVVKETKDEKLGILKEVVFQYPAPDGSLTVEKRYWLEPVTTEGGVEPFSHEVRDTRPEGYVLRLEVKILTANEPETVKYTMLGPAGIPLENRIATYKWRDAKFQSEVEEDDFEGSTISATNIVEGGGGTWTNYLTFVGIDTQYFAALVFPEDERNFNERITNRWLEKVEPLVLELDPKGNQFADISFQMVSQETELKPNSELVHDYNIYLGPKRDDLLEPLQADYVAEVWSWISWLSKPMMALLTMMHESMGFPYWLGIICLTIIVRALLHPITRKQMASAKRMKELQPKIAELKKKYGNDREKMAQAQMQLYREHNFNPFAGCLPVLLQMPIFIALYQGLRSTIDLRLAEFLWIDNLAAPDMLFELGIENLPFLGDYFYYFNLLPVLTVLLFIVQNKMLMPQPDPTDEMAVQTQKMMKFMMVAMGFMFYHVPSGLCLYFITSSIWSLCERKMIDYQYDNKKPVEVLDESPSTIRPHKKQGAFSQNGNKDADKKQGKVGGLWNRILEAAEAQQQLQREREKFPGDSGKKKKKKR